MTETVANHVVFSAAAAVGQAVKMAAVRAVRWVRRRGRRRVWWRWWWRRIRRWRWRWRRGGRSYNRNPEPAPMSSDGPGVWRRRRHSVLSVSSRRGSFVPAALPSADWPADRSAVPALGLIRGAPGVEELARSTPPDPGSGPAAVYRAGREGTDPKGGSQHRPRWKVGDVAGVPRYVVRFAATAGDPGGG